MKLEAKPERTVEEITQYLEEQLNAAWEQYEQAITLNRGQHRLGQLNGKINALENALTFIDGVPRD